MPHPASMLIESPSFEAALGGPLVVVDGGARGDLWPPLDTVDARLRVYAFEPDTNAPKPQTRARVETHWLPEGLWKEKTTVPLHVARQPSASSVYPPDMAMLGWFEDRVGAPARTTTEVAQVPVTSIDAAVAAGDMDSPHLIKLDIHSAEYEALIGAPKALEASCVAVLVEAWHWKIHAGQHLYGEIETLLTAAGFRPFNFFHICPWKIAVDGETHPEDEPCLVASEVLFLKAPDRVAAMGAAFGAAEIAIAQLFGYRNYAIGLTRHLAAAGTLDGQLAQDFERQLSRAVPRRAQLGRRQMAKRYIKGVAKALLGRGL